MNNENICVDLVQRIDSKIKEESFLSREISYDNFLEGSLAQGKHSKINYQVEKIIGEEFSTWAKKNKRLNISSWEPNKSVYPQHMLLGTDRGILAYIEFYYHSCSEHVENVLIERQAISHPMTELRKRLAVVDSDLDRPVFYIHIMNYEGYSDIVFETTEMIKDKIFSKDASIDVKENIEYYFSNTREMGTFLEVLGIFEDLKRNNVKYY